MGLAAAQRENKQGWRRGAQGGGRGGGAKERETSFSFSRPCFQHWTPNHMRAFGFPETPPDLPLNLLW